MSLAGELSPLLDTANADNVPLYAGLAGYPNAPMRPAGLLTNATLVAAVAAGTGTSEQVLATYSLPAGALDATGRRLKIRASFVTAANTQNKTCKLYFGTVSISTGVVTTSAAAPWLELTVTKSGSSTQLVSGHGCGGTTGIVPVALGGAGTATEADTAAIVIKATGTDGTSSAGDITIVDFCVEYDN